MSVVTFGSCSFSSQTSFAVSSVSGCLIYKTLEKVTFLRIKTNIMLHGLKTSALQPPFYWPDQPWPPPASPARPSSARRPWFFSQWTCFLLHLFSSNPPWCAAAAAPPRTASPSRNAGSPSPATPWTSLEEIQLGAKSTVSHRITSRGCCLPLSASWGLVPWTEDSKKSLRWCQKLRQTINSKDWIAHAQSCRDGLVVLSCSGSGSSSLASVVWEIEVRCSFELCLLTDG